MTAQGPEAATPAASASPAEPPMADRIAALTSIADLAEFDAKTRPTLAGTALRNYSLAIAKRRAELEAS